MTSGKAEYDGFCSAVDEDTNCQDSLKYVIGQMKEIGTHIIGFWKKIVQNASTRRAHKVTNVTEERVPNQSGSQSPTAILDDGKNNIYTLKHMARKLVAVGTHFKGLWSKIVQIKNPKRPQNIVHVKEEEVPYIYDSQMPTAIVNDNMCPFSKVDAGEPDNNVQKDSSPKQNADMGIYNSNAGNKKNSIGETEILSLGSFKFISDSSNKRETSRDVDLNTEVASDQQAVKFVPSTELSKSDGSASWVDSDGSLSLVSVDQFSSEDDSSDTDYVVV